MRNRLKLLIVSLGAVFAVAAPAVAVSAQTPTPTGVTQQPVACGVELKPAGCTDTVDSSSGEGSVMNIIKTVINVLSLLVGSICIIMIIFGGFKYLTSGGESAGVSGAKNTILYAVVGLIIVLLAQAIVRFVFTKTTTSATP